MINKNQNLRRGDTLLNNICIFDFKILLKCSKISLNYQNNNIIAFSLIELSIVLIIIGLLVAGVTGGASKLGFSCECILCREREITF